VALDVPLGHADFGKLRVCVCREEEIRQRERQRLFRASRMGELQQLTFDTFQPRGRLGLGSREQESLERAFRQARLFAEEPRGWLLLQGGFGAGKTHLAAAIANAATAYGLPTLFLTVPDLLDGLRATFDDPEASFDERFEEIRQAPLLVLDDLGTQNATDWAREKLFQILNHRYVNRLPTVLTTNQAPEELDGRLRSRLSDPGLVTRAAIVAPDYRRPVEDTAQPELSSLGLHSQQTFGTFSLRQGEKIPTADQRLLEEAFRAAREFAEDPQGWLVLSGPYGSGKTHLAAAIANYRAGLGEPAMFVVVPDLLDHLRATFNPSSQVSYDRRFEEIRSAQLLVLDDLGTQATTAWAREKLFQIFNHRYNAGLPTVITTALSADELGKAEPRLYARLLDRRVCVFVAFTAPPFRGSSRRRAPRR
jgi:DNA replication protein DnaC